MKLNETPVEIERGGSMIESAFGISEKDSVHIVSILRDKLYSNKILAVVREYSTNAQDAHTDAGKKDLPIRVTLPGPLDPTFRVRDFGGGLSEEDIRTVYALYGASTKRNSNEVVGQLGLGCKAAFAYTDKFNIVSWQGGLRKTYIAYIDETRLGKIALVDTSEDSEPDGIEIQVPVKTVDFYNFKREAEQILPFFRPEPELIGGNIFSNQYDITETTEKGVFFGVKLKNSYNLNVIMGGIPYSISYSSLQGKISEPLQAMFSLCLDVYVNIGDVDIAANRETLEFTKKTINTLSNHLFDIGKIIREKIFNQIKEAKTFREANELYGSLKNSREFFLRSIILPRFWNNKSLTGLIIEVDSSEYTIYQPSKHRKSLKWYNTRTIRADKNKTLTIISIDDSDDWSNKLSRFVLSTGRNHNEFVAVKWMNGIGQDRIEEIEEAHSLDEYDYRLLSDCKVERVKTVKGSSNYTSVNPRSTSHLGSIFKMKPRDQRTYDKQGASKDWEKITEVEPEKKYYVKLDKFKAEFAGEFLCTRDLSNLIHAARTSGFDIFDSDVYGVKTAKVEKLDSSWVSLVDVLKEFVENSKILTELKDWEVYNNLTASVKASEGWADLIPVSSPIKKLSEFSIGMNKTYERLNKDGRRNSYLVLVSRLKITWTETPTTYKVEKYIQESTDRYPLLAKAKLFPGDEGYRGYYQEKLASQKELIPHIVEYINMVENEREKEGVAQ